ncbi:MAG TPA: glycosyltransferase family 39 protein [Chloroflexia bacterium]|nr:glycosyltransferase family 39 protein [Chloroflexia bacterium]
MRTFIKAQKLIVPVSLYVVAAALLLFRIGGHPPFVYNWDSYTAWGLFGFWDHPSLDVLRLNQGLMTDSSHSALTILPAWLGLAVGGIGLAALRAPFALIAAGAVPLLWLVGRRMFGQSVGLLAAILLALSPVFLLYGRTATLVGISLVPALLTIYALMRVLQRPQGWGWLVGLQILLLLGAYAYAPIRFLWPLSLMLLLVEWIWRRSERRALLVAFGVTIVTLPAMLVAVQYGPGGGPISTLSEYYGGRGEQIGALSSKPQEYAYYIELTPEEKVEGKPIGSPIELAWRLVSRNTLDYANLLFDWDTRPALRDYWNSRGRLYPMLLVPFFLLGLGRAAWRGRKRAGLEYRVLLVLFFGFGLPLLLTSRVHIGRLIFVLPLLMVIVSLGYTWAAGWVVRRVRKWLSRRSEGVSAARGWRRFVPAALTLSLIAGVGWLTWLDYHNSPPPGRESATVAALKAVLPEAQMSGGVAVVVNRSKIRVFEEIDFVPYWLDLNGSYRYINLFESGELYVPPAPSASDPRPPLYLGGIMARLEKPESVPNYCGNIYYVDPAVESQFLDAMKNRSRFCSNKLKYKLLPW